MCKERYINPFTDFGFKLLFGTAANKEFLISFLNSLFGADDPIVDINYRNVEQLGMRSDDRNAVFDIYCTTQAGAHVIVEMQNGYQRYFLDRSIFYSSYPMHEVAKKGDWDFRLPKIYTVAFLNFRLPEFVGDPDFKHVVKLTDQSTGKVFYDKLTYIYLEMPKFDKDISDIDLSDETDVWMYIIKNINQLDGIPEKLRMRHFQRFFRVAEIQAFSSEERMAYELSLKAMRDYNNTVTTAKELGIEEGMQRGKEMGIKEGKEMGIKEGKEMGVKEGKEMGVKEGVTSMAKKMLESGMSIEEVKRITSLSDTELKNLQ